jgi:transketolase
VAAPEAKDADTRFDVVFVACGVMVKPCLDAARDLEAQGIRCAVANFASVKPLDTELLVSLAKQTRLIVTAEEHNVLGGLGGAVCEAVAEKSPVLVRRVGVQDRFGESGPAEALLEAYGLTSADVVAAAKAALEDLER